MRVIKFRVQNYRNIIDSGWVNELGKITAFVGQNEAGKSNLFEALYRVNPFDARAAYNLDEDWPVDRWGDKAANTNALVCTAVFELDSKEIEELWEFAAPPSPPQEPVQAEAPASEQKPEAAQTQAAALAVRKRPKVAEVLAWRRYGQAPEARAAAQGIESLQQAKVEEWVAKNLPKFVYIHDYEIEGSTTELDQLAKRLKDHGWNNLTSADQTILIVLELAKVDIDDFLQKGATAEGRTIRAFDKVAASSYLSQQFNTLWRQKNVRFNIEIDATTLNIFAEDAGIGMPVRLSRRSTGFRWHVSFAWKFTHASSGQYKGCVLLLEEPGIHLHYSGQRDVLQVFERLAKENTLLYTTHLASMVDPSFPERVRIVEVRDHHTTVLRGVVSSQRAPMAVIEACLGLTGDLGGLLGNRCTLIVEGGDDALILHKLSGVFNRSNKEGLSDRIYLWPASGASKTPMYAAFAIGQKWDAAVLLDSDQAGKEAKAKIKELYLDKLAEAEQKRFRIALLDAATGVQKTDVAIEDIFPDEFYLDCVNSAYRFAIKPEAPQMAAT